MAENLDKRVQEIEGAASSFESQLRAQIARAQSGTRAWLIVGIILIAAVFGYMSWLSKKAKEALTPEGIIEILESQASKHLPVYLNKLEATATDSASDNVEFVLEEAVKTIPELRRHAKDAVDGLMETFTGKLDEKVDEIVGDLLAQKKKELDPLIEAAAQKGETEALEEAFRTSLEELIGYKMDEVLVKYDAYMTGIERRLNRLSLPDTQLSKEECLQKEIIVAILIFIDDAVKEMSEAPDAPVTAP